MKIVIAEWNWPNGIQLLEEQGWRVVYDPDLWRKPEQLERELADADGLLVRNQTKVHKELLEQAPVLQVVGRLGVGLDNIDLDAAAERGIRVVAAKNANAASVAEYVIAAMFHVSRRLGEAAESVRSGRWDRKRFTLAELGGRTLGLIGTGEIGHRVAVRARALGLRVLGYDPRLSPYDFAAAETGIVPAGLETVLGESDYISLHVPLTPSTRGLINTHALSACKPSAVLINTSRGGVVEEEALLVALQSGRLAGAVLDVLAQEPPEPGHPLLQLPNCWVTPHVAGLTEESQERTAGLVSREVITELCGGVSLCRV